MRYGDLEGRHLEGLVDPGHGRSGHVELECKAVMTKDVVAVGEAEA
jgi:hypothetical protein